MDLPTTPRGLPCRPSPTPPGSTQRFIAVRRREVVDQLADHPDLPSSDCASFRPLANLLAAVFHHDFRTRLEDLKDAYTPFDPDPDTRSLRTWDDQDRADARRRLYDGLRELLEDGNFEQVTDADLDEAFEEESLVELRLEVDESVIEEVLFFRRGETVREEQVSSWWGLRHRDVVFTNYEKVLMLVTFRDADDIEDLDDPEDRSFEPGSTVMKLFQDVPRADLEMLFPNVQPRMRRVDKLMIGVPAVISGVIILVTKALATLGLLVLLLGFVLGLRDQPVEIDQATLVTLGAGLGSLGGYLVRQVTKYRNRKLEFTKALADHLYFRNLDNDMGVVHHLVDDAEEEEVKEALLAWTLLRAAGQPLTAEELDDHVEGWLADTCGLDLDFEVDDGLAKLRTLRLVEDAEGGRLQAVGAEEAMRRLDERWDAYFTPASRSGT